MKKCEGEVTVRVKTIDDTAKGGDDYGEFDKVITIAKDKKEETIEIEIIDDDQWEPDEDFYVELQDPLTGERLAGEDTQCRVTIIDDDEPGVLAFEFPNIKVRPKDKYALLKVQRSNGSDGVVKCHFETKELEVGAKAYDDYCPQTNMLIFAHGETVKEIKIEIIDSRQKEGTTANHLDGTAEEDKRDKDDTEKESRSDIFIVKIFDAQPDGCKISKRNTCQVEIVADHESIKQEEEMEKLLNYFAEQQNVTWCGQFKQACMLQPQVDEDGGVDDISCCEAFMHFLTIGWKVLFAIIPPRRYKGGWPAFFMALGVIGAITAVVGELATVLGCVLGIKASVTAITLVSLGTSVPDTFASKQAAQQSQYADSAIGNVTGSNSVNVFLGLGLPWIIGTIYYKAKFVSAQIFDIIGHQLLATSR